LPARLKESGWRTSYCTPFCVDFYGTRFHDSFTPTLFDNICPRLVNIDPVPRSEQEWRAECIDWSAEHDYLGQKDVCGCAVFASLLTPDGKSGGDQCAYGASPTERSLDYIAGAWRADGQSMRKFGHLHLDHGHKPEKLIAATLNDELLPPFFDEILRADPGTAIILMSDHGRGKTITPMLNIVLPQKAAQTVAATLGVNRERLITLTDLHTTLGNLAGLPRLKGTLPGIDLLDKEVPANRTCADANIPAPFCPCLVWTPMSAERVPSQHVARALAHINELAEPCTPLRKVGGFARESVHSASVSADGGYRFVVAMTNGASFSVVTDPASNSASVHAEHSFAVHEKCTPPGGNAEFCFCARVE
jgi:Protein of unknown function (DUF229)